MNVSKMYVPNVGKWIKYYQDIVDGKKSSYNHERTVKQRGSGLSNNSSEFMIPIDSNETQGEKALPARRMDVDLVSPVQQVVEQAKSELKRKRTPITRQSRSKRRSIHISKRRKHLKKRRHIKKKSKKKATQGKKKKSTKKVKRNDIVSQWLR